MEQAKQPVDEKKGKKKFDFSKKNVQLLIAAALGILILVLYFSSFSKLKKDEPEKENYQLTVQVQLTKILSKMQGVAKVQVIVTCKDSGSVQYAQDRNVTTEKRIENGKQVEVIVDSSKVVLVGGKPLIEKQLQPEIMGVVIVCQGGGNPATKMEIIKATMTALSIRASLIEVFACN